MYITYLGMPGHVQYHNQNILEYFHLFHVRKFIAPGEAPELLYKVGFPYGSRYILPTVGVGR